jgi:hypothetical protein
MPRRRSAETMERDHQAYDLFRRGLSYRQIAAQQGYKSASSAVDAVRRAARENAVDPLEAEAARQVFLDRFQDYRRAAQRVLSTKHYIASAQSGKLAYGPDGQPLVDDDPVLRALDRLAKIDDMELRLRDLYPPARARIEVIDDDVARALADEAEAELARITDAAARAGHSVTGNRPPAH